ncbi:MAG: hypothetical protein Q7R73_01685 [bacterium]|nr:hypothetical protein [bacterium]
MFWGVVTGLLLFPWILTGAVVVGSVREFRRRRAKNAKKKKEEVK